MTKHVQPIDTESSRGAYFAPATIANGGQLIHVSGQIGATADGHVPADYGSQIHLALLNVRKVLATGGATIEDIVKLTIYIVNYDPENPVHRPIIQKFYGKHRPAMTLVPVQQLAAKGWLVEIDAVAIKPAPKLTRRPSTLTTNDHVDVVIIGAGLAGLAAAHQILQAGHTCVILEARDRVGGRTYSHKLEEQDGCVDLGAAWLNDTNQTRMITLARRYGAELLEQSTNGLCILQDFDGTLKQFPYGELPGFGPQNKEHLASIRDMVDADSLAVDCANPKDSALDALSLAAYLKSRGANDLAMATATIWSRAMLGQEPTAISALFFLNYCKSGGGLINMRNDRKHGPQYLLVRQGTQLVANGLAKDLPEGVLRLGEPVTTIDQSSSDSVAVHTARGVVTARKVISAVPQPTLRNITFTPALPPAKSTLVNSFTYGYYGKALMVFKKPFWLDAGFCGLIQSFTGPAAVMRDSSAAADNKWVLTCFCSGEPGRAWGVKPLTERRDLLLDQLQALYGEATGVDVRSLFVDMKMNEWTEQQWSYGCPAASLPPGVLDTVGHELRSSVGSVHFAGTETAAEWKGYMEGAVRSGERAAGEVLARLKSSAKL